MDLNEILIFARVARAGSFTKAARDLELPKSTVSRKVSRLEARLGVRLLHRTTRNLTLTDAGVEYYRSCSRVVADLTNAELAVTQLQASPRGTLRITAPVEFGAGFLGPLVVELLERHEDLRVDLVLTDRVIDLVTEGFDAAIRAGLLKDSTLVARKLGTVRRVICVSPDYFARKGVPRTPDDLRHHDCIIFHAGHEGTTWRIGGPKKIVDVLISGPVVVNNFDFVHEVALAGVGIACLPTFRCAQDLKAGRLQTILDDWTTEKIFLSVVYPSARYISPKVRALLNILKERTMPLLW